MPSRKAPRRFRAGALDRRAAVGAFALAAVTLAVVTLLAPETALVDSAPSARRARDPQAARDVVELMRAGERGSWSAVFDFTRTLANGRVLRESMQEARNPVMHVLRSGSSMTIQHADRNYDCNLVEGRSVCTQVGRGKVLPASEVVRVAVATGAYDVTRLPDAKIAGDRTRCFRVRASGRGYLPDLGSETDVCLATDGVPLSAHLARASGDVDERVARAVDRQVTTRTIEALAAGFGPPGTASGPP